MAATQAEVVYMYTAFEEYAMLVTGVLQEL